MGFITLSKIDTNTEKTYFLRKSVLLWETGHGDYLYKPKITLEIKQTLEFIFYPSNNSGPGHTAYVVHSKLRFSYISVVWQVGSSILADKSIKLMRRNLEDPLFPPNVE